MDKKFFKQGKGGPREAPEFDQKIIDLARVTRVMAGGKRMRFRACVVIGNKKGQLGLGMGKGADVTLAVNKAAARAKKHLITVPTVYETIPHTVNVKFKAAKVLLKPAPKGTGIKAGGAVRMVLELSGVQNVVGKILGSNNKINNVKAVMEALSSFKPVKEPMVKKEQPVAKVAKPETNEAKVIVEEPKKKAPVKPKKIVKPAVKKTEEKVTK